MAKKIAQIFTGGKKAPTIKIAPPPEPEKATPLPDEEAIKKASMKAELMRRRTGRSSTLLTDDEDNL